MPSTHLSLHYHLVFSIKKCLPIVTKDWRELQPRYCIRFVRVSLRNFKVVSVKLSIPN